jgi:hypothetical protein
MDSEIIETAGEHIMKITRSKTARKQGRGEYFVDMG